MVSGKVYDKIHISPSHFSKEQFFEITTLTKWILVDQIGTLLLLQLSLIIVNKEFGNCSGWRICDGSYFLQPFMGNYRSDHFGSRPDVLYVLCDGVYSVRCIIFQ